MSISSSDIILTDEIGSGEFGVVNKGRIISMSLVVAVKKLVSEDPESIEKFKLEAAQMQSLEHKNVLKIIGTQFESSPFMIVLEHMPNGDLKSYFNTVGGEDIIGISHVIKLVSDVAAGFSYLQSKKFVHRDLAARNVLLDDKFTAKIGDFGMTRQLFSSEYYHTGSTGTQWALPLRWMAPESYTDGTWNLRSDVWMFGVLIWEIFSRCTLPWAGLQDKDVIRNIQFRAKLKQPDKCPNEFYFDIMLSCWRLDPFARITGDEIESAVQQYIEENKINRQWDNLIWPARTTLILNREEPVVIDTESVDAIKIINGLEIDLGSITIGHLLGQGAFGEVHKGVLVKSDGAIDVAVKTIKGLCSLEERRKFTDEAKLFALLHHPNIVSCIGVHLSSDPLLIVLELMQCDLKSHFKKTASVSSYHLMSAVLQIGRAMEFLSSKKIIHRDLAARNVLVGNDGLKTVKLNDFGLSRSLSSSNYYKKSSNDKIPVKWMAPESVIERKYSSASDVWSFGVFCWEVFEHGKTPYSGMTVDNVVTYLLRGNRMSKPQECPDAIYDLILQCWQLEVDARPSFKTIVSLLEETAEGEEESRL